jgi:antirestriction protein ArdC
VQRIERAEAFFAATRAEIRHGGNMAYYNTTPISCRCRLLKRSAIPKAITLRSRMNAPTERAINPASIAIWSASAVAMPGKRWRNWWLNWPAPSCAPTSI